MGEFVQVHGTADIGSLHGGRHESHGGHQVQSSIVVGRRGVVPNHGHWVKPRPANRLPAQCESAYLSADEWPTWTRAATYPTASNSPAPGRKVGTTGHRWRSDRTRLPMAAGFSLPQSNLPTAGPRVFLGSMLVPRTFDDLDAIDALLKESEDA